VKYLAFLLLTGPVYAQQCTTLLYMGAPFTLVSTTGPNQEAVTSPLTGSVTLASPLPANGVTVATFAPQGNTGTAVTNWSIGEPYLYPITNGDMAAYGDSASFSFTTSNGVIVNWSMSFNYNQGGGTSTREAILISSTVNGDSVAMSAADPTDGIAPSTITGSSSSPGAWTCQQTFASAFPTSAPPVTPPPAPAPLPITNNGDTVANCPTATAGAPWAAGAWLPCNGPATYIAQPVPTTALVTDMRCPIPPATGACTFSWQTSAGVKSTDQVWVKSAAKPNGTWVNASTLVGL
jgi:hypothetical protein